MHRVGVESHGLRKRERVKGHARLKFLACQVSNTVKNRLGAFENSQNVLCARNVEICTFRTLACPITKKKKKKKKKKKCKFELTMSSGEKSHKRKRDASSHSQKHHKSHKHKHSSSSSSHKHAHKSHSKSSHSHHKSRRGGLPPGTPQLTDDDFFARSKEFRAYLSAEKRTDLSSLDTSDARSRFKKFVKKWNAG